VVRVTIIAEGWVQGVGYRAFVKRTAGMLGLRGLVRNLPDGKVEVFVEGTLPQIDKLVKMMSYKGKRDDPLSAYVEDISLHREGEKEYRGPWKKYEQFDIDFGFEVQSPLERALLENLESGTLHVVYSRDEFELFRGEFGLFRDEFGMFRKETSENFKTMEERYGSISEEMKKMRGTLEKLVDAYIKRQK
jgi:acylphosphatase